MAHLRSAARSCRLPKDAVHCRFGQAPEPNGNRAAAQTAAAPPRTAAPGDKETEAKSTAPPQPASTTTKSPATRVQRNRVVAPAKVKMPAAIDDLCFGAAGRFMVLGFEGLGKVAVFDVFAGKIVGYLPTQGHGLLFAAGAEKLVVFDPQTATIQRYALEGLKLEDSQPFRVREKIDHLALGASSHGPILFSTRRPSEATWARSTSLR